MPRIAAGGFAASLGAQIGPLEQQVLLFRRGDTWLLAPHSSSSQNLTAMAFAGDGWKDVDITESDIPPLHVVFQLGTFARKVMEDLGMMYVGGTADDFRKAGEAMTTSPASQK
jgi:hypothetical protein